MRRTWLSASMLLSACVGDIGPAPGDGDVPIHQPAPPETGIAEVGMRRLTVHELDRTLTDLVGAHAVNVAALLPADPPSPFDNDYPGQIPSRTLVEGAEILARDIIAEVLADPSRRDALLGCAPTGPGDSACLSQLVESFGRRALRRPVAEQEIVEYTALGTTLATQESDFYTGMELVLRALLQDLEFLYRVEIGTPVAGRPGVLRLNGFEVATRMSYLVWGTGPDDDLLDLAMAGGLDETVQVVDVARTMLDDPRARPQIDRFHALWLGYETLQHAPALTHAMRAETRALVDRVVFEQQSPWVELFLSQETYVGDLLAQYYGLPAPGSTEPVWMDYSAEGRRGILSHGSFLSVGHDVADTSPVRRGLHVLRRLTCQDVPPPPPGVDTDLTIDPAECKLDELAAHASGTCAACHAHIDPIGLGLEGYDVAGRPRDHEDGKPQCPIDGEGELAGVGSFQGPAELGQRLVASGLLEGCAVTHLYQYAIGRKVDAADRPEIDRLTGEFTVKDRRFDELVVALVSSDAFFFRRDEGGS